MSEPYNTLVLKPHHPLNGTIRVPGDKSISHRAVLFGMLAHGQSDIHGWLNAGDTEATLAAARALGVPIERHDAHTLTVHGGTLIPPKTPLNFENAGTGIRLAAGIMAGQNFSSILDGSEQLRRRPMKRITDPLQQMGANITSADGKCPLQITPAPLKGIHYEMPVASAQVKSAILLAGLFADGTTTIIEPGAARDHSERMLQAMGANIHVDGHVITLTPDVPLHPLQLTVPGDFSSAAFLIVAACIIPDSDITIENVNLNPTRTGLLDALQAMNAHITVTETGLEAGEPIGAIHVKSSDLTALSLGGDLVVRMIDEFPILMVAALFANGETIVHDAQELRVKETDRIAVMAQELRNLGAQIQEYEDGFKIKGHQRLTGTTVDGHDDHRVAMSLAIAGLCADEMTVVTDARCTSDSFPNFPETLQKLGGRILNQVP